MTDTGIARIIESSLGGFLGSFTGYWIATIIVRRNIAQEVERLVRAEIKVVLQGLKCD